MRRGTTVRAPSTLNAAHRVPSARRATVTVVIRAPPLRNSRRRFACSASPDAICPQPTSTTRIRPASRGGDPSELGEAFPGQAFLDDTVKAGPPSQKVVRRAGTATPNGTRKSAAAVELTTTTTPTARDRAPIPTQSKAGQDRRLSEWQAILRRHPRRSCLGTERRTLHHEEARQRQHGACSLSSPPSDIAHQSRAWATAPFWSGRNTEVRPHPSLGDHLQEVLVQGPKPWRWIVNYDERWPTHDDRHRARIVGGPRRPDEPDRARWRAPRGAAVCAAARVRALLRRV